MLSNYSGGPAAWLPEKSNNQEGTMKLDVPDDYVALFITALEHHYAYTKAVLRDDARYRQAADWSSGNGHCSLRRRYGR